jgi:hypothetical protein
VPDELSVEFAAIQSGGKWTLPSGKKCGEGLFHHYREAQRICWPNQDHHRWSDLALSNILGHRMCGLMGPGSSNKTFSASKYALIDYWAFPNTTLILVSSTDVRGLELRVWGKIKEMFNEAIDRFPWLPGNPIDYLKCITTDEVEEGRARTLTKGIICIPCLTTQSTKGLGKYIGTKSLRMRLIADECQLMGSGFLDATANLQKNPDWKFIPIGNPAEQEDPLGMACEPKEGWTAMPEPTKTTVWDTKFLDGVCVNFVGTDSPNFDFPEEKAHYNYLPSSQSILEIELFWGKDSWHYSSQAVGIMRTGLQARRVITRDLCKEHHAQDRAVWGGTTFEATKLTRIYAVDAAFGGQGGDRCVGGYVEFGEGMDGYPILRVNTPVIVPVSVKRSQLPEDQIAEFVLAESQNYGIPPENIFYDSTGRGTLGSGFARIFGPHPPVPIEFGGGADRNRPVRHDLYTIEGREKRLKTCFEHYLDKVSQLWFTARYVIESNQMRELPEEVMKEGCSREFGVAGGNKLFVESKHDPRARLRMKRSPDLFDWLVTCIEGAIQRGFKVARLGMEFTESGGRKALDDILDEHKRLWKSKQLTYR